MVRSILFCLTAVVAAGLVGCQAPQNAQNHAEQMLREFLESWSPNPDVEKIVSYFAEECVCENVPREAVYHTKGGVLAYVRATYEAVPDLKVTATSIFVSGDWAACEWVMAGTTSMATPDSPGAGKSFSVRGSSIIQLKDGKIRRLSDYWDRETFLRQIGVLE